MRDKQTKEKLQKVDEVQKETIRDVVKNLNLYGKCFLIRPTGFGKTKVAVDIANKFRYIVFMCPTNGNKAEFLKYELKGDISLYCYHTPRNQFKLRNDEFRKAFSKYNTRDALFVFDEAHCIGSTLIQSMIESLMKEVCPLANYLGLTATPDRRDGVDVKWHFFDGYTAYEYTIADAIKDGILLKPYYVYTPLDGDAVEKIIEKRINESGVSGNKRAQLQSDIRKRLNPEKLNIKNLDDIIRRNVDKFKNDDDYYKFVLFFSKCDNIYEKREEIIQAFSKVFPHCTINAIEVHSKTTKNKLNLKVVNKLRPRKNTIDLIFGVDMLTQSYHSKDITGIMMFRKTISNTIYNQQIGRCLSIMKTERSIIFDIVENHKMFISDSIILFGDMEVTSKRKKSSSLITINDVEIDSRTKDLLNIDRVINSIISEEFEAGVVRAYRRELVDIDYCMMKLHLQSEEDFLKVVERHKNEN